MSMPKARLRISGWVAYQHEQGSPVVVELQHARLLEGDEQEFIRRVKVGEQRQPLSSGWLEEASLVVIENRSGEGLHFQPDPATRLDIEARILEVGVLVGETFAPFALIRPGMQMPLEPCDLKNIHLRCQKGEAHISVSVFPA